MIELDLSSPGGQPRRYLFLGAHCDDIEIGCGGTILRLMEDQPDATVDWVVFSSGSKREREARNSAARFIPEQGNLRVHIYDFRNSFFPQVAADIKEAFEQLKAAVDPDVVFTHYRADLHQDHRVIGELTWNTFRNHLVLEYEIPKYDGGLGSPGAFVSITEQQLDQKIAILLDEFESQRSKKWFTDATFRALPRLRGIECNAPDGLAEAFYCPKICLKP
jgi:LmbE family N-acetylglucosaminyl deacetylase